MRVEALLCDAATVREGLLHMLGAGVTRVWRDTYPAPLGVQLAMMLTLAPVEAKGPHQLKIIVLTEDGTEIARMDGQFQVGPPHPDSKPGEPVNLPMVLDLRPLALPGPGTYSIEVLVDSQLAKSLPFAAAPKASKTAR